MFPGLVFNYNNPLKGLWESPSTGISLEDCLIRCQNDPLCKAGQYYFSYFKYYVCVLQQLPSSGYVTVEQFKKELYRDFEDGAYSFYKKDVEQDKAARSKHNRRLVKGKIQIDP